MTEDLGITLHRDDAWPPLIVVAGLPGSGKGTQCAQAAALERAHRGSVVLTVLLVVPLAIIEERLRSRGRADDVPSVLRERLVSFERDTRSMLAWYAERGSLAYVDGNRPQSDVTIAVEGLLAKFAKTYPTLSDAPAQPFTGVVA